MIRRRLIIIAASVGLLFAVGTMPNAGAAPAQSTAGGDPLCVVLLRQIVVCPINGL